MNTEAAELEWSYNYTGTEQEFTAPYTGIYQFELAGAQGGNSVFDGGKGGKVTVSLSLKRGDKVDIIVGGQDGYNGGGTGTVSNGGGATDIRINGNRIAIAGGGGGGTEKQAGGNGGAEDAGNNGTAYTGSTSSDSGSAGGGAGYIGGNSGRYYKYTGTVTYTYTWSKTNSWTEYGECRTVVSTNPYSYCTANRATDKTTYKIIAANPTDSAAIGRSVTRYETRTCPAGHAGYPGWEGETAYGHPDTSSLKSMINKTGTITRNKVSFGGSNWYDTSICTTGTEEEGTQNGNGVCNIRILSLYNLYYQNAESLNVFYDGQPVKNVYYDGILIYQQ